MNKVLSNKRIQTLIGLAAAFYGLSVFYLLFIRDRNRTLFPGEDSHLFDWNLPYARSTPSAIISFTRTGIITIFGFRCSSAT